VRASTARCTNWMRCQNRREAQTQCEAVVDRFKVRADLSQRLAESFETALRLSNGTARVVRMDGEQLAKNQDEWVFSNRFACPVCGYSLASWSRAYFHSTILGRVSVVRWPGRTGILRSRARGASPGTVAGQRRGARLDRRNAYYFQLIQVLAKYFKFDVEAPYKSLSERLRKCCSAAAAKKSSSATSTRRAALRVAPMHGKAFCPHGTPLSRNRIDCGARRVAQVFEHSTLYRLPGHAAQSCREQCVVADHSLPRITAMSVGTALAFFDTLTLPGWRGEIASKIRKEIADRLRFLADVGLEYLTWIAAQKRCPAANRNAFVSPVRSAPAWSA